MVTAFLRAVSALSAPPMRRIVGLSLGFAVLTFAVLWLGVAVVLYNTAFFDWRPLNWLVNLLGGLGVLFLSWLLFPAVVTLIMGFYLNGSRRRSRCSTIPDIARRACNRLASCSWSCCG